MKCKKTNPHHLLQSIFTGKATFPPGMSPLPPAADYAIQSRQIFVNFDLTIVSGAAEKRGHRFRLIAADLQKHQPILLQTPESVLCDSPVEIESVASAVKSLYRFVIPDFRLQRIDILRRYIRRIRGESYRKNLLYELFFFFLS